MQQVSTVRISRFMEERSEEWDAYGRNSKNATFFHLSGWKNVLEKNFGYKSVYLMAEKDGEIYGVLPLFLIRNLSFKKALVSFPFAVYGGVCADDEEAEKLLIEEAKRVAKDGNVDYLELRNRREIVTDGFKTKDLYVTFVIELPDNPEALWKSLDRKARGAVRKGIKSGLKAEMNPNRVKEFYNVFAQSYRNLGTPVFSLRYMENLLEEFKNQSTILCIDYNGKMIAGVLTFFFKDTVIPYYGGSSPEYLQFSPNNFMYWELMRHGCENGYRYFDFGRSRKDSGAYFFKKNWGFTPEPLYYQYHLNGRGEMPNISPSNPKFDLAKEIWRRLPLSVTKILGPKIVKYIP